MSTDGTRVLGLGLSALCVMSLHGAGCGPGDGLPSQSLGGVHLMRSALQRSSPARGAQLLYYGGPVISQVKVWTVYWGPNVPDTTALDDFYKTIVDSPYLDWLSEYNTPKQQIGRGTLGGSLLDGNPPAGNVIDDNQIQAELERLIDGGLLPPNDGATLYMVHFPPNITITAGGDTSCVEFCAYHGTAVHKGSNLYYGVVPDLGGACANGCGDSSKFANTTSVASHELVEAITDSAVALANDFAAPLAWYDPNNGEIGDICVGTSGVVAGYEVQTQWSNSANACVLTRIVPNEFKLTVNPPFGTLAGGTSIAFTVATALVSGRAETIDFTVEGLPAGVTGRFSPPSVATGGMTTLTVTAQVDVSRSVAPMVIKATAATATHSMWAQLTVTHPPMDLVANGDFESGSTAGWTATGGETIAVSGGHGGLWATRVGHLTGYKGDSTLSQKVTIPVDGTTTLKAWYYPRCPDVYRYDQQQAFVLGDNGERLVTLLDICDNDGVWKLLTADLTGLGGRTVTLQFLDHDEGDPDDPTWFLVDDISVINQ